ncbi:MAG: glycoside hydrolase family 3 C-terminal domain-containing protein [Clostridia bacterium]|nr:glycoside hydrolase family 3 C-terminal domain-containing protein [Clostridia bacterium]
MKLRQGFSGTLSAEISERELRHLEIARRTAGETMVLLENDGVLPLKPGERIALYGAGVRHPILGGTGSGSVNCRPGVTLEQAIREAGLLVTSTRWLDALDASYEEARKVWMDSIYAMSIPGDFDSFYTAYSSHPLPAPGGEEIRREADTDTAIYVISRVSGEGADRHPAAGDFLLSRIEEKQLREVCDAYPRVIVVLNVGGVLSLEWMDDLPVSALLLMGQAGQAGGLALADILTGRVNPSARLAETWGGRYEDYPCADTFSHMNGNLLEEKYREDIYVGYRWFDSFEIRPRYPFGYGLSYTSFRTEAAGVSLAGSALQVRVRVANEGHLAGKETVFLFAACPEGLRKKERKRLIAFGKTGLLQPGEEKELVLWAEISQLASWHTGKSAWMMDAGSYALLIGKDAEHVAPAGELTLKRAHFGPRMQSICPLHDALPLMEPGEEARERWRKALRDMTSGKDLPVLEMDGAAEEALRGLSTPEASPAAYSPVTEKLTLEEKACLVCGRPRAGKASIIGSAAIHVPGAAAETTSLLEKKGVPPTVLADGPAGLRLNQRYEEMPDHSIPLPTPYEGLENRFFGKQFNHEGAISHYQFCTAIPVGMNLAQSFNPELVAEIGAVIGREMEEFGITWWLAPGMNIKRNPLCGRNFEYYSEDPLVSGRIAAALTRGVQKTPGAAVTIKHFACNNQEDNRRGVSSIVSERALREIYLKGFEIAVREAQPWAIMTSYNKVNGEHTANSHDLCTTAAREQWGFRGIIMTDWTTTNREGGSSAAKCIAAGNDLVMPGTESDIMEIVGAVRETGDLSLPEKDLDACCHRILSAIDCLAEPEK